MMGDIAKNYDRIEFACKCGCGMDTVDTVTLSVAQYVRDFYRAKVTITSGCRCLWHNKRIGSDDESQHPRARAIDFKVEGVYPEEVHDLLDKTYPDRFGLGLYVRTGVGAGWVHFDSRTGPAARWTG